MSNVLSLLAGLLNIGGIVPYIAAILSRHKKSEPSIASWLVWAILDCIVLLGMLNKHTANGLIIVSALGSCSIFLLSLKFGFIHWTKIEIASLIGAGIGIILWIISGDSNFGIAACLGANLIAAFPTFKSAWYNPEKENRPAWTIFWIASLVCIAAIRHLTFADAAQPICFALDRTVMMFILYLRPLAKK
jgi:hypothetical protein